MSINSTKAKLVLVFILTQILMSGQLFGQRVSIGAGLSSGIVRVPNTMKITTLSDVNGGTTLDTSKREGGNAAFIGLSFPIYVRLFNINDDNSIGIAINPTFGGYIPPKTGDEMLDSFDPYGFPLFFHMPVMLHYSYGMFSTVETEKDFGWGLSVGVERTWMNDSWHRESKEDFFGSNYILLPKATIRPVAALYFRHWTSFNLPVEWALQYSSTSQTYALGTISRPMVRLSWSFYFNY
jgi:hypothetical protein